MEMRASWLGPYSWPGFENENGLPELPAFAGVYLWTVEHADGYLIYLAGITVNLRRRFKQHTDTYVAGGYTLFDMPEMKNGRRKEIWHGAEWAGWRWAERPERRTEFATRQDEIRDATNLQLRTFRVFAAQVDDRRVRERIEAAIMNCLYAAPSPMCDVPDRGMRLTPRRSTEEPITIWNACGGEALAACRNASRSMPDASLGVSDRLAFAAQPVGVILNSHPVENAAARRRSVDAWNTQ